jgi:hypothetical protein
VLLRTRVSRRAYRFSRAPAEASPSDRAALDLFRNASVVLAVLSMVIAALLGAGLDVRVDSSGISPIAWLAAALLLVARIWRSRDRHTRIADVVGTLGLVWTTGLSCGAIAMLGLRLQLPMADKLLMSADHAIGVDGLAVVDWLLRQGQWIFSMMAPAYGNTIPLLVLSMLALAVAGKRMEAWRAAFCFIGSLLSICLFAIATPAKGLALWAPPRMLARLPDGAMRYFWGNFDSFYAGTSPVLGLQTLDGVISFPSFHAAMGFITVAMWRNSLPGLLLSSAWLAFMLLATFPYGGHYVVDVLGGLAIAAAWFALSRTMQNAQRATDEVAAAIVEG